MNNDTLSMDMARKLADRFNEIGLRQNAKTLAVAATMMGVAIKTGGVFVAKRKGKGFMLLVVPQKKNTRRKK